MSLTSDFGKGLDMSVDQSAARTDCAEECTALVWMPQLVLRPATQVESKVGEREPA